MFGEMNPLLVPLLVCIGGVLSPVLGWARAYQNSKTKSEILEPFDFKKLVVSAIIAVVAILYCSISRTPRFGASLYSRVWC